MLNVKKKAFVMGVLAVLVVGFGQNVARAV
jgi:hypothetical protein